MAEETKKTLCEVSVIIGDKTYKGKGNDILSALKKVKEPTNVKSMANFETVIDGKLAKHPLRLNPTNTKRLFANEWEMKLLAKKLQTLR